MNFDQEKSVVVCVGSALMDILVKENDAFLEAAGVEKGGMNLVESSDIDRLMGKIAGSPAVVSGGSACNTAIGVGMLGGNARFVGKRGEDQMGDAFAADLESHHVEPQLFFSASPTGRVLSVITPDAQRTMFTYLGAAAEMVPEEITPDCFENAAIVHVEGYLLFNTELMSAVLAAAKSAGAKISLDLASFNVVEESKAFLDDIVREYIDILIANEDEARAFTGHSDEDKAMESLAACAEVAVLKLGARGSRISCGGRVYAIDPQGNGNVIDTTGAGDLWAAGFLFGLINGFAFEKCGTVASACGFEVCRVIGAKIPVEGWDRIRQIVDLPKC